MNKKTTVFVDGDAIISQRPSGIGTATVSLIRALSEDPDFIAKYRLSVIVAANKVGKIERWKFNDNVNVKISLVPGRIFNGLLKYRLLPPMDIIFGRGVYLFPNFRNWPLIRSPSATYIHDASFKVYPQFVEKKNLAFLNANIARWIDRTSRVITVSKHAQTEIEKYFPEAKGKTSVVYNGIDDTFKPLPKSAVTDLLRSYGLTYKKYFMFLSNIEPRKNLEGVLAAYELFCKKNGKDEASLLIVGGMSWSEDVMRNKIDSMQKSGCQIIRPSHYVEDRDLPGLLSGAACLVHAAFYEGFGISPLQAMACGTQVIVSDVSSLPEVVGDAGEYVDPDDVEAIAGAMQKTYNKRHDVNTKGIARAKQFTWKKSAKHLAQELVAINTGGKHG